MALRDKMKEIINDCELLANREKGKLEDVKGTEVTFRDFAMITVKDKKTEELKQVPAVVFDEYPEHYFFGGFAFRQIIENMNDNDKAELRKDGLKILLEDCKTSDNKTFTKIRII